MSLETLYNNAQTGTYVNKVKTTQASDVGAGQGVNFMDGTKRARYSPTSTPAADQFQTEFQRNAEGTYVIGGAQGTVPPTNDKSYALSRWTDKALKLPFESEGPSSLPNGYYTTRFRTAITPAGPTTIHNYTPLADKKFKDLNTSAAARINSKPTSL